MITTKRSQTYVDIRGNAYGLSGLDVNERAFVERLQKRAAANPEWHEYSNSWMPEILELYKDSGMSRREIIETIPFRIAQDLGSRLGIAQGKMRPSDYRDQLEMLIHTRFQTRREFCEATGLTEDMLSHVLAGRKNLSIGALTEALSKIGYTISITPVTPANS